MVFRKPYAFLIKNFKKIHIAMLVLCVFVYFKVIGLKNFMSDFLNLMSYDPAVEPISKHLSILFYLALIIVLVAIILLMVVLIRKGKPWKSYLILLGIYGSIFLDVLSIQSYFSTFDGVVVSKTVKPMVDILEVISLFQYIAFVIIIIRITGLDLNKFGFKNDKEFLELDKEDRAEFEISLNFDEMALKRLIKRLIRNTKYVYQEHRLIMNILIGGISLLVLGNIILFISRHRTVLENKVLKANNYEITINNTYYSDKDKSGNVIEKNSAFVVIDATIKNNTKQRKLDVEDFHLKNGNRDITIEGNTYNDYFSDLGKGDFITTFRRGEERKVLMVFKVDKKLNKKTFALYYQQFRTNRDIYLRKIKINPKDISKIITNQSKKVEEEITLTYPNKTSKSFIIENYEFVDNIIYNAESCNEDDECKIREYNLSTKTGNKIMKIDFSSNDYEGKELIDFCNKYGKIKYVDSKNMTRLISVKNSVDVKDYLGKKLFIVVPNEIEQSKTVQLIITLRNQRYYYNIK